MNSGKILAEWKKAQGTATDTGTQSQTTPEQPKAPPAPVATEKSEDSKASQAGVEWKKRIPSQYHADLEGLDDASRTKVLGVIEGLDKPRQADYTKKTTAHAERLKKLEVFEALAKEIGVEGVDQVAEAARFAANLYQMNPVIKMGDKEIRLRKEPEIPDLDMMNHDERVQWLQKYETQIRAAEAAKGKAELEQVEAERKKQEYLRKVSDNFESLKKAKSEITDDEWTEAQAMAASVRELMMKPDSGQTVEEVETFFKPFLLAARANRAAKAAGLQTPDPTPKTSSIDAPQAPTKAVNTKINSMKDAVEEFKRMKGIRSLTTK